jgi:hypothetical protein
MGNESTISFWYDIWHGSTALAYIFPHLYAKIKKKIIGIIGYYLE